MSKTTTAYKSTDVLLGDGNARVERNRFAKHALGYGEFAISGSCTVSIRCNQDDRTIVEACKKAGQIADQVMKQDDAKMLKILSAVAKEMEDYVRCEMEEAEIYRCTGYKLIGWQLAHSIFIWKLLFYIFTLISGISA